MLCAQILRLLEEQVFSPGSYAVAVTPWMLNLLLMSTAPPSGEGRELKRLCLNTGPSSPALQPKAPVQCIH